jgi:hypothetical protein
MAGHFIKCRARLTGMASLAGRVAGREISGAKIPVYRTGSVANIQTIKQTTGASYEKD